jgi:hypothetical protein
MNLDDQLSRYFGTTDFSTIAPAALEAGVERIRVDFGLETDRERRFAPWVLLYMLGAAPDLDVAFEDENEREAARNFIDLTDQIEED